MQLMLIFFSALHPIDRSRWQFQNLRRQIAEGAELQARRFFEWLQRSEPSDAPDWLGPLFLWLLRGAAVMFICIFLYWGVKAILHLLKQRQKRSVSTAVRQTPIETQTVQDWLAQASAAQSQQDYAAACRALYMALLIHLEKMEWLAQNPALTDQEYLRRLDALWVLYPQTAELPQAWSQLFNTHELICYGAQAPSLEAFQRCQQAYQRLMTELTPCRPVGS